MEEKRVDPSEERVEPVGEESDKMECEEVLSGSESMEMVEEKTDSSDKADDKVIEVSPVPSDSTSGVEMKYETPSPFSENLAAEAATAAPVAAVGEEAVAPTAVAPVAAVEEAVAPTAVAPVATVGAEAAAPVSDVGATAATSAAEFSPPEKSKKGGFKWNPFSKSPTKKDQDSTSPKEKPGSRFGSLFRTKSLSPPQKPLQPAATGERLEPVGEGACAVKDDNEDPIKKAGEKTTILRKVKKTLSGVFLRMGGSSTETEGLVWNQEEPGTVSKDSPAKTRFEEHSDERRCVHDDPNRPRWTEGRQSLPSRGSLSLTQMTNVPSLCSDVFPADVDRKPSETGENTSEEAVAGSLASSSDDQIPEIQSDEGVPEVLQKTPVKRQAESPAEEESHGTEAAATPRKKPNLPESSEPEEQSKAGSDCENEESKMAEDN